MCVCVRVCVCVCVCVYIYIFLQLRRGHCWQELDEITNIHDRVPQNSMILTPDEVDFFS